MGYTFVIKSYMCKNSGNDISGKKRILHCCEDIQNFSSGGKYLAQQASEIFSNSGREILHHEAAINVGSIYYTNTNEISNQFTDLLRTIETVTFHMLFALVKILCFCTKTHLVFYWCIYNNYLFLKCLFSAVAKSKLKYWTYIVNHF